MGTFFLILGIVTILYTVYDMSVTVLGSQGAGVVTDYLTKYIWNIFLKLANYNGINPLLQYASIIIIIVIMANWIILLWLGTTLIYLSHDNIIVDSSTEKPVELSGIIYFAGYILATLGNGDLKPQGDIWRLVTNVLSFSGLIFITMTVSYLMNVLSGDTKKRKLSRALLVLGNTPLLMAKTLSDKAFIDNMESYLATIGDDIFALSKNLESYPILHYYHTSEYSESLNLNLTVLDEALSIIVCSNKKENIYKWPIIYFLRTSVTAYLETQKKHLSDLDSNIPPLHHINEMDETELSTLHKDLILGNYKKIEGRRRILQTLLRQSGHRWEDVFSRKPKLEEFYS